MFFDDEPLTLKKRAILKELPPVPDTGWKPPQYFPNLSDAAVIGFDVETKENDFDHGPGWSRGQAGIVGLSVAAIDRLGNRGAWYFPIRHEVEKEWNLEPQQVLGWAREQLQTPHIPKIGANLIYDTGNLTEENIYVEGDLHDVQFAEALIDDGEVNLEYLAQKYLGIGKESNALYQWCSDAFGGAANGEQRSNIWRAPPRLVGPYAEADAWLPIEILQKQWTIMQYEGTLPLYRMECDLIPLWVRMRLAGVRVNVEFAQQLYEKLGADIARMYVELKRQTGVDTNVLAPTELARVFDQLGIPYRRTASGNPSFQKEWLKAQEHPLIKLIVDIRELEKLRGTFVRGYLLERNVNGVIHCQFHPLRGDGLGAKTGRLSSSDPNLQNVSVRSETGKLIRKAFVPDIGHIAWEKNDFSQIEYRMLAHYAVDGDVNDMQRLQQFWNGQLATWGGLGHADRLRWEYQNNPDTDYHVVVQDNVKRLSGLLIERRPIKNINFGMVYGQGEGSLAYKAGFKANAAKDIFKAYHIGAPYVKPTMQAIGNEVQHFGYVSTILGRRVPFKLWEPRDNYERDAPALRYETALKHYGTDIVRAYAYRGVNYKLQGSGTGDVIKAGTHKAYKEGVFETIGVPRLQVHDELDFSVIDDTPAQREGYEYMRRCLETAVPCRVPIRVDFGRGASWGEVE